MKSWNVYAEAASTTNMPSILIEFLVQADDIEQAILAAEEILLTFPKHKFVIYNLGEDLDAD